jgi:hypothetical protein
MIGKLAKSKVSKQTNPDRSGLYLHPRYLSIDPPMDSIGFQ